MPDGTIKFYNQQKEYGFIKPSSGDKDIFFHKSGLIDEVTSDDRVTYNLEEDEKKRARAVNIKVVVD